MTASTALKNSCSDWHPADIKAALAKKGFTLSRVARENGYAETSPSNVFRKPWPAMEKIIADIIGFPPFAIWPSRYDVNGNSNSAVRLTRHKRSCNG